eukprot:gene4967-65112_t
MPIVVAPTIRSLSLLLSVLLVVCAGLMTAWMTVTTADDAIRDTRRTGDSGVAHALRYGKDSVNDVHRLLKFLEPAQNTAET